MRWGNSILTSSCKPLIKLSNESWLIPFQILKYMIGSHVNFDDESDRETSFK